MKIRKITKKLRLEESEKACKDDLYYWEKRVGDNNEVKFNLLKIKGICNLAL